MGASVATEILGSKIQAPAKQAALVTAKPRLGKHWRIDSTPFLG